MKSITKVKEVKQEVKVFVAFDGTEFPDEYSCTEYEHSQLLAKAKEAIPNCKELNGYPPCDGYENCESNNYWWFYPTSEAHIELLKQTYPEAHFDNTDIDNWLCIEDTDDGSFCWVSRLEDAIRYVKHIMETLGYEVSINKAEGASANKETK